MAHPFEQYLRDLEAMKAEEAARPSGTVPGAALPLTSMELAMREKIEPRTRGIVPISPPSEDVPDVPLRVTPAGVHGSGALGFLSALADILGRTSVSYRDPRGRFSFGRRGDERKSAVDEENEHLRLSASTMAKRRWDKAAKDLEGARKKYESAQRGRATASKQREQRPEAMETLPAWVTKSLGLDDGKTVLAKDVPQYISQARQRAVDLQPKQTRAATTRKLTPHRGLYGRVQSIERNYGSQDEIDGAALVMLREMLARAKSEADLAEIDGWAQAYPGIFDAFAPEFNEREKVILGAAR